MQGDFEKQVRSKMDELKMFPSAPVWKNIEPQIRQERKRRRAILWLPLLLVPAAALTWWYLYGERNELPAPTTTGATQGYNAPQQVQAQGQPGPSGMPPAITPATQQRMREQAVASLLSKKAARARASLNTTGKKRSSLVARKDRNDAGTGQPGEKQILSDVPARTHPGDVLVPADGSEVRKSKPPANTNETGSIKEPGSKQEQLPAATENSVKPAADAIHAKWKFGFRVAWGLSGITDSTAMFRQQTLFSSMSSSPVSGVAGSYQAPEERSTGFTTDVFVSRQVGRRLSIQGGVSYTLLRSKRLVGQQVNQDTAFGNRFSGSVTVDQFFRSAGGAEEYTNRYHFLGIPVVADYQLFRKIPLSVTAGISLQRLIASNALYFDPASQVYYHDMNYFNRTQVFGEFGLNYTLLERETFSWQLGPRVMYSFSDNNRERAGGRQHLTFAGISSKILFTKR
ncbi:MAG TPA: hypothetical protein VFZ78_09110 [Flavisolibacter sp.]